MDSILKTTNDDFNIIENQDAPNLEKSLIKLFRGYMLSEMCENDTRIERATLSDDFLTLQTMIREIHL